MRSTPPLRTLRSALTRPARAPCFAAAVVTLATSGLAPRLHAQPALPSCSAQSAELAAVEGSVTTQSSGESEWRTRASGERVCFGDTLRVDAGGRALLTLPDQSNLVLAENTTVLLTEPKPAGGSLIQLFRGLIHVISRDPRQLQFTTPFANAGLEGTEFDLRVNEREQQTEIAVLEGEVRVRSPSGELGVTSGHLAVAKAGLPPTATALPAPIELMRWASYYPLIIDAGLPAPDQAPAGEQHHDAGFFASRAAARLGAARLAAAQEDLATALGLAPRHTTALALQAILALARADTATAQRLARDAASADGTSVVALIARSHVEQATGDVAAAERTVRAALALEPTNAVALTHMAELRVAAGDAAAGIAFAERARSLAPARSAPVVALGFAHLRSFDTAAARAAFERAVVLEPEAPLPRLGLALAAVQRGDLVEGRRQLEAAVANDPANAVTRSYMAKIYDVAHRHDLTTSQLELAKDLDPEDATPWLYSALHALHRNRPVDALRQLRGAAARHTGETAFRSQLAVDQDLATRSAALARIYTGLGFGRLARVDAWRAVAASPSDYTGHRLLADLYATEPRHEIARVSELLVSQLLQPANVTPVKPQLGQPGVFIAQRAGPSHSSFDEFSAPLVANGLKGSAAAVGGGNGTAGTEITVAGLHDRWSYSAGHYRFATDGFRANNDLEQEIASAFVQFRPSFATNLQAEVRSMRAEQGDLAFSFDSDFFSPLRRLNESTDSVRLGAQRRLRDTDTLLASFIAQDSSARAHEPGFLTVDLDRQAYSAEMQHIHTGKRVRVQSGWLYAEQDEQSLERVGLPTPGVPATATVELRQRQLGAYSYWHLDATPTLMMTLGASFDRIEDGVIDDQAVNPKIGVTWRASTATTIRAAAFRTLYASLTTSNLNPQPRLEPVQTAGFTQLLLGGTADRSRFKGVAVDHEATEHLFLGWEAAVRNTTSPAVIPGPFGSSVLTLSRSERTQEAYLYWTPTARISVSARYEAGRFASGPIPLLGFTQMTLRRLPVEIRWFASGGLSAGARLSRLRQQGLFQTFSDPTNPTGLARGSDEFSVVDAFINYRLANRRGILSLNADNLLDQRFRFQDVDPTNLTLIPERLLSFRFTVAFD